MKKSIILTIVIMLIAPVAIGLSTHKETKIPIRAKITKITYLETKSNILRECELEEYLVGVLAAEMPAEYELEALKAQAVAARSYIVSKLNEVNTQHPGAIVCDNSSHCKAHLDKNSAKSRWDESLAEEYWEKLKSAVDKTKGEYMVCENEVVEAFFFARSSGRTESSEDVWGEERPYLKSVESVGDKEHPEFESTAEFENETVRQRLLSLNKDIRQGDNPLVIGDIVRTAGGSVKTIEIDGKVFKGTELRNTFGLKSANFLLNANPESVSFSVFGYGHGVGMSQYGANTMAKNGKKYTEILSHYYTNIQIIKL